MIGSGQACHTQTSDIQSFKDSAANQAGSDPGGRDDSESGNHHTRRKTSSKTGDGTTELEDQGTAERSSDGLTKALTVSFTSNKAAPSKLAESYEVLASNKASTPTNKAIPPLTSSSSSIAASSGQPSHQRPPHQQESYHSSQ